jgi:FdrA protein
MWSPAVIDRVELVMGRYFDSVRLMQVTRDVNEAEGVEASLVAMATDLNLRLLGEMGFDRSPVADAGPDDLLVAIRATDQAAFETARAAADRALAGPALAIGGGLFTPPSPHTVAAAAERCSANLALISVPGAHAFVEAIEALRAGLHVMLFSDNVAVEHEVLLKREAATRGLLVMGPDCGTAIVNGVGLGFANAVDPGPVAICGASGTGIQQLCCLLDAAGVGVRHALGAGSRDLCATVAGATTLRALVALDADPTVEVIIVVSKPPAPEVAIEIERVVAACTTPVVVALLGAGEVTLEAAAAAALTTLGVRVVELPKWRPDDPPAPRSGWLRGFFSGGTLRDEARSIATAALGSVAVEPTAEGHRMVDFGADEFTRGRAHPMIDQSLRLGALSAAAESSTGAVLLDVVLGYGAHPDPAAELVPAISDLVDAMIPVVVSLCGTRRDPQGRDRQAEALRDAGADVYLSNAAAARRAVALIVEEAR